MEIHTRTYSLVVDYHKDDDMYVAYFPALPGCHTWANEHEDVVGHAKEALIGYLEALHKAGRRLPIERAIPHAVSLGMIVEVPPVAV